MGKVGKRTTTTKAPGAVQLGNKFDALTNNDDDDDDEDDVKRDSDFDKHNVQNTDVVKKARPNTKQRMRRKIALAERFEDSAGCDCIDELIRKDAAIDNVHECDCREWEDNGNH